MAAEYPPLADRTAPHGAVLGPASLRERLANIRHHAGWLLGGLAVTASAAALVLPNSPVLPTLAEFADETAAAAGEFFDVNDTPKSKQAPVQVLPDTSPQLN